MNKILISVRYGGGYDYGDIAVWCCKRDDDRCSIVNIHSEISKEDGECWSCITLDSYEGEKEERKALLALAQTLGYRGFTRENGWELEEGRA